MFLNLQHCKGIFIVLGIFLTWHVFSFVKKRKDLWPQLGIPPLPIATIKEPI